MRTIKQQVEAYLKTDRTLLGGRNLYNKLANKNRAVQNSFSRFTDTPENCARLHYELAKCAGIPPRNLTIILQQPIQAVPEEKVAPVLKTEPLSPEDKLIAFKAEDYQYAELKQLVKDLGLQTEDDKTDTFIAALNAAKKEVVSEKIAELPEPIKASIKLRDQFPFLREKDCPDVLKLIVNELITAYETFKSNQPKLHDLLDEQTTKEIVDTVKDNYIANKQAYDELEFYKTNKAILGKHPIFKMINLKTEITKLDTLKLANKIHALTTNINRNKKAGKQDLVTRDEILLAHAEAELDKRK